MVLAALVVLAVGGAPSTLERDFPRATLSVRPGEATVSMAIGLDAVLPPTEEAARGFLARYAGAFGLSAEDTLVRVSRRGDRFGTSFRFERWKAGVPVDGAQVVVTFDGRGRLTMIHAGAQLPVARGAFVRPPPSAGAERRWIRAGDALRPAWVERTRLDDGATRWRAVDAETGVELARHDIAWTANGRVYDFSPVRDASGPCPVQADGGYAQCASTVLRPLGNLSTLSGPRVVARNCLGAQPGTGCLPRATPNTSGDFDEQPNLTTSTQDRFGEVMAYYHADRFSAWLDGVAPAFQAAGGLGTIDVFTNVGNYENAYFDQAGPFGRFAMRLGQGALTDWAYDADVLWHEMGHGVVQRTSGFSFYARDSLGVQGDPGALNEGTADCLSLSFKGFPELGENAGSRLLEGNAGPSNTWLRSVATRQMCQISGLDGTGLAIGGRIGQIHRDGVIWGSFFWRLRQRLAPVSTAGLCANCNAADVVLMAALDALGSGASFHDATLAVQQATASRFGASAAQLVGCMSCEWDMPSCDSRLRFIYPGETHQARLVNASAAGSYGGITPATFQFALDVPANTTVTFNRFLIESGTLTIFARFDGPIQWTSAGHNATHSITAQGEALPPQAAPGRWYLQAAHDGGGPATRVFGIRVAFTPAANTTTRPPFSTVTCALGGGIPSGCNCTPQCAGKQCGSDGCGGTCGTCPSGQSCSASSQCNCTPQCAGKQCGPDGCGGVCGQCASGQTCTTSGACACTPSCGARVCGDDGCGGSCGSCASGQFCSPAGACEAGVNPCAGKACGPDGMGGSCGACPAGQDCNAAGACELAPTPCAGKQCGPDGQGGECGACPSDFTCSASGRCESAVQGCGTRLCGPDGNGGSCGSCAAGEACTENGTCVKVDEVKGGCGCATVDAPAALVLLLALVRRRRSGRLPLSPLGERERIQM